MEENTNPMTKNQIDFCELYLQNRNGTRSYAIAYKYLPDDPEQKEKHYNSWSVSSSKLLQDKRIQRYLSKRVSEMDYNRELTDKEIIAELNKIALGGSIYKENTRMDALKQLIKINGMTDESTGQQAVNINLSSELTDAINKATE